MNKNNCTKFAVSYVDAKIIGSSSFETKFLMTCLIVSVDKTVEIPRRLPKSEERVLLPVPDVPASNINMFLLDSKKIKDFRFKFLQTKSEAT